MEICLVDADGLTFERTFLHGCRCVFHHGVKYMCLICVYSVKQKMFDSEKYRSPEVHVVEKVEVQAAYFDKITFNFYVHTIIVILT